MFHHSRANGRYDGHSAYPAGEPIGFLMQHGPQGPPAPRPSFPPGPGPSGPFTPPPWQGGPFPPQGINAPLPQSSGMPFAGNSPVPNNPAPGLQGMLQSLTKGFGSLDLPELISNAQKWMGMFNQLGSVLKQAAPLLQLIQGLSTGLSASDDEILSELTDDEKSKKKRKKRKRKKERTKSKTSSKKRSPKQRVS